MKNLKKLLKRSDDDNDNNDPQELPEEYNSKNR
jgi:hypothetical protein